MKKKRRFPVDQKPFSLVQPSVVQNPVVENLLEIDALMSDVGVFCGVKFKLDALYQKIKDGKGTESDATLVKMLEDMTGKLVKLMNALKI